MKKLLVVVDYQNDFIDGSLGFKQAAALSKDIVNLVKQYVTNRQDIVFTMDSHQKDYLKTIEGKKLPIKHTIVNSLGWQLHKELLPYVRYGTIITKDTFGAKELFEYFKTHKYKEVQIIGVVSDMCVLSNAVIIKACLPDARIVVNHKLVASPNKEMHQKAMDILKNIHIDVV